MNPAFNVCFFKFNLHIYSLDSHVLTFTHVSLCTCNPTSDPFRIIDYQEYRTKTADAMTLNAVVGSAGISDVYLTNGQYQPKLTIAPGQWVRLEMVNAVGDTFIEVELRDAVTLGQKGISAGCQMKLLALDGVFLFNGVRTPADNAVLMNPASRASIAVMCSTAGTRYLQTNPMSRASDYEATFLQNLLTIEVTGTAVTMTAPAWTAADIERPYYLKDLRTTSPTGGADSTSVWQVGVEQSGMVAGSGAHLGVGKDCALDSGGRDAGAAADPNSYGSCPYVAFATPEAAHPRSMASFPYRHVAKACDVEDLVIQGRGATPHPIHIHVNHFQVIESTSKEYSAWGEIGDWRDTIGATAGTTRVRYVLDKYGGNIMMHCHFLMHEDVGMMDRIWVEPSTSADALRCTATGNTANGNQAFCSLAASSYATTAYDDAYPSVTSTCDQSAVACTAVDSPSATCLKQTCSTSLSAPYTGCLAAACTTSSATPHAGCVVVGALHVG
jgi:hypothetical protein